MGLNLFARSSDKRMPCNCGHVATPTPPEPDPVRFRVEHEEQLAGTSILLVHYSGCTTFNGRKLLLLNQLWDQRTLLDPHLLGDGHIVVARFEPNEQGWSMARACAWLLLP